MQSAHAGGLIMFVTVPSPQSGSHTMKINKALLMRLAPLLPGIAGSVFGFSSPFFSLILKISRLSPRKRR